MLNSLTNGSYPDTGQSGTGSSPSRRSPNTLGVYFLHKPCPSEEADLIPGSRKASLDSLRLSSLLVIRSGMGR